MQEAIDRVMQAYTLMVNLTPEEERTTRERLGKYLADIEADDNSSRC